MRALASLAATESSSAIAAVRCSGGTMVSASSPRFTTLSTTSTQSCDACAPPACPPMPSATRYSPSCASTRWLSSLWLRTRPTSVAGQAMIRTSPAAYHTRRRNQRSDLEGFGLVGDADLAAVEANALGLVVDDRQDGHRA